MSLIRHSFAAAALLILLGAGTSCERASGEEKTAAPNPAMDSPLPSNSRIYAMLRSLPAEVLRIPHNLTHQ